MVITLAMGKAQTPKQNQKGGKGKMDAGWKASGFLQ